MPQKNCGGAAPKSRFGKPAGNSRKFARKLCCAKTRERLSVAIFRHFAAHYRATALEHVLDICTATCYGSFRKNPVLFIESAEQKNLRD